MPSNTWLSLFLLPLFAVLAAASVARDAPVPVALLTVEGGVGPATADYVVRSLALAERGGAQLLVLRLDTPGGLDSAMREIIKAILASPVPVAAYVAPSGARAASAGTYILYASHIAAMAPGTNLGAATPVNLLGGRPVEPQGLAPKSGGGKDGDGRPAPPDDGDTMRAKQINDASAYLRGLAQMRGRNVDWAEKAVRESLSLSADEALKLKVVDLVAADVGDLLKQLNGRKVTAGGVERTLSTGQATIQTIEADWRTRLLSVITEPDVAYILLLIGIYGLLFEFYNPGFLLPGVVGAIALLTALFAFQLLPVNYAGLGLLSLGIIFMVAEAFVPSFGSLGIGGAIAFVLGSVMLMDTGAPGYQIPWPLIAAVTIASLLFVFIVVGLAVKAYRRPVVTGKEELLGCVGELLEDAGPEGFAFVRGEHWRVCVRGPSRLRKGDKIRVVGVSGLLLDVVSEN
jgi:membrane-bound serine protease (ClpP class)